MLETDFDQNVGVFDRWLRLFLTLVCLYLGCAGYGGAAAGIFLMITSCILALTALIGACPCYALLEISTQERRKGNS